MMKSKNLKDHKKTIKLNLLKIAEGKKSATKLGKRTIS
jgi:hypothetical protein